MILPESLLQDVRYAIRMLYHDGKFTALAVFALALGIGVNTAVFTAYKAMVARPLDARDPDRVVNIALIRSSGAVDYTFSYPDYEAYRDSIHSFSGVIAFATEHMTLSNAGRIVSQQNSWANSTAGRLGILSSGIKNAEFASVFAVSENFFKILGVPAMRGRTFDAVSTADLAASPSVLISENYWQKRFAGDLGIIEKTIHLNGAAVTIIGVTPHDFVGTNVFVPDFWVPLSLEPVLHADRRWLNERENTRYRLYGRVAPHVTMNQAQSEITLIADRLRALHDPLSQEAKPATAMAWRGSPFPMPLKYYRGLEITILLIMIAAGMVLAVACANVGSLQLARTKSRQSELQTRLSLGASRRRIIRQMLTESGLLGVLAGMVALPLTSVLLNLTATFAGEAFPEEYGTLIFNVNPDLAIFSYVFAISVAAGILFGLAPAIESSGSALSSSARGSTSSARSRRLQDLLVTAQVSLSLVLMIAGSMFIRSSIHALRAAPGYDSKHVIDLDFQFPEGAKYTLDQKIAIVHELQTQIAALPGVSKVSSARAPGTMSFTTAALAVGAKDEGKEILHYTYVQANYFETLGIPIFLGRSFASQSGRSVVLSESAAKQLSPGQNAVGRFIRLSLLDEQFHNNNELTPEGPEYEVIGVSRNTRGFEFDGSDSKQIYLPVSEDRLADRPILIQAQSDPALVLKELDRLISSVDPALLATSSTLEQMLHQSPSVMVSSLAAAVASTVGMLGLMLALVGIYGTVSYIVVLRTREIGIRMAVGAQKREVLGLVLRESARPVVAGLICGILLTTGVSYLLRGVLYGLVAVDGISFGGVSLLFLAVALLAVYPPSRRAMRIDPAVALRYE